MVKSYLRIWDVRGNGLGSRLRGLEYRGRALGAGSEGPRHGGKVELKGDQVMRLGGGFGRDSSGGVHKSGEVMEAERPRH